MSDIRPCCYIICTMLISVLCQPGHYNSTHGVEPCLPCPKLTYQLEYGATVCIPCSEQATHSVCPKPSPSTTLQQPSPTTVAGTVQRHHCNSIFSFSFSFKFCCSNSSRRCSCQHTSCGRILSGNSMW